MEVNWKQSLQNLLPVSIDIGKDFKIKNFYICCFYPVLLDIEGRKVWYEEARISFYERGGLNGLIKISGRKKRKSENRATMRWLRSQNYLNTIGSARIYLNNCYEYNFSNTSYIEFSEVRKIYIRNSINLGCSGSVVLYKGTTDGFG